MHRPALLLLPLLVLLGTGVASAGGEAVLVAHVTVRAAGDYRISAAELRGLGIPSPAQAELRVYGTPVPPSTGAQDGDLRFRVGQSGGRFSAMTTFELWRLPRPRQWPTPAETSGAPQDEIRRLDTDRVYGELAAADPEIYAAPDLPVWFLAAIPPGRSVEIPVGPMRAAPEAGQRLSARVYTTHRGPVVVQARWGGTDLGLARLDHAIGGGTLGWRVPAEAVPSTAAPLQLLDRSPAPPPRPPRDVSGGRGTILVDALLLQGPALRLRPVRPGDARDLKPRPVTKRADPLAAAGTARHVIIATPPLVEAAGRLAAHRTRHGIPSAVVPVTDLYDRYGYGNRTPMSIVAFLDALRKRPGPPLEYVVLAGDATFDRTDFGPEVTIPTLMARSMYNGATASDRLYTLPAKGLVGGASIGRLPFRKAAELEAYVERLIRYETAPAADPTRRMLRFVTSEGRFGAFLDAQIERKFRGILAQDVPPAFEIEVTFASATSPFLWPPPDLNRKVLDGLNEGALFYTYVGHGFAKGFDTLRIGRQRYPILHVRDVPQVDIRGTPPIVLVIACTTAWFDGLDGDGIGEALLKRPNGPIAYWGATRVCHPIYNTFVGQAMAQRLAKDGGSPRLGGILDAARDHVLTSLKQDIIVAFLKQFAGVKDLQRLMNEGALMYTLLGDPALKVALPKSDIDVAAAYDAEAKKVLGIVRAALPDGTKVHVSLEVSRERSVVRARPVANPADPANFDAIRKTHARMNDWALHRTVVELRDGKAQIELPLVQGESKGLIVKAWAIARDDVHQGATVLR